MKFKRDGTNLKKKWKLECNLKQWSQRCMSCILHNSQIFLIFDEVQGKIFLAVLWLDISSCTCSKLWIWKECTLLGRTDFSTLVYTYYISRSVPWEIITSKCSMTDEWRIGKDLKGSNCVLIEVVFRIPEATVENHENCQYNLCVGCEFN
jgi:hypothetical protein